MEKDLELSQPSEFAVGFFIPDSQSQVDDTNSLQGWDLITGLPALKTEQQQVTSKCEYSNPAMSGKKDFNPFASTESDIESQGQPVQLVTDTCSDSQSKDENEKNITVVERIKTGEAVVSTPSEHIGSLHLSAQPIIVAETMDSLDEVAPSPDAFGSIPMIIPDSPSADVKDEDDGVVSFKPILPTMDPHYQSGMMSQAVSEPSQSRAESQSFHLQFTPSQVDDSDVHDAGQEGGAAGKRETQQSSLKLRGDVQPGTSEGSESRLSFHLQKPTMEADNNESDDEHESSVSVFKRVKSGNTTPHKLRLIREDSDEILQRPGLGGRLHSIDKGKEFQSPSRQAGKSQQLASDKPSPRRIEGKTVIDVDTLEDFDSPKESVSVKDLNGNRTASHIKGKFSASKEPEEFPISKEGRPSTTSATKQREQTEQSKSPQASLVIYDHPESMEAFGGQTLSYEYPGEEASAAEVSGSKISEAIITTIYSSLATKARTGASSSDEFINPSQKRNPASKKKHTSLHSDEEPAGIDPYGKATVPDVDSEAAKTTEVVAQKSLSRDLSQLKEPEHEESPEQDQEAGASKSVTAQLVDDSNQILSHSQEPKEMSLAHKFKSIRGRTDEKEVDDPIDDSRAKTAPVMPQNTRLLQMRDKASTSSAGGGVAEDASNVADMLSASSSWHTVREGSTFSHPRSLDPYIFHGSQSQNFGDVSALPLSDRPQTQKKTTKGKKRVVKTVRKVLKKKAPSKLEEGKSSSTDVNAVDTSKSTRLPARQRASRKKQQESYENVEQQEAMETTEAQNDNFTVLQQKGQFSKPANPPPTRSSLSSHNEPTGIHTHETQQLSRDRESTKHSKKPATVSFSDVIQGEPPALVRELSDNSEHEVERTTVERVMTVVVTLTEKTKTEVYNARGKLVRHSEAVEEQTALEPSVMKLPDVVRERIVSSQMSPSRSASTVTSGDLADVSSSSLSRTYSSGSKTSNPSLEAVPPSQGLPTPAQRQRSLDNQDGERPVPGQEERTETGVAATTGAVVSTNAEQKRLSTGSNTGQDLFSTPNQSIIDHADSQIGKVISSSNSTPGSHTLPSPNRTGRTRAGPSTQEANDKHESSVTHDTATSLHKHEGVGSSVTLLAPVAERVQSEIREPVTTGSIAEATTTPDKGNKVTKHGETPQRQSSVKTTTGKRLMKSSSDDDNSVAEHSRTGRKSAPGTGSKKRKVAEQDRSRDLHSQSTDSQSTGFSVHGVPPSVASGNSNKVQSSKSSAGFSPEISLQGAAFQDQGQSEILTNYKSKVETGAKVMGKWNDGFYYPGVLSKVDLGQKRFMIKYDDGTQRALKAKEIILAAELPVGQSVMVCTDKDYYEPGMIMRHSKSGVQAQNLTYHVERDDGQMQKCDRGDLILSEDQAACLLSDEELRVTPDAIMPSTSKPADISLDNLVEGKRHPRRLAASSKQDQPSTSGFQSASTAATTTTTDEQAEEEPSHSGKKRKIGPRATSTPTPKQLCRNKKEKSTPVKKAIHSTLGGVVSSPSEARRSPRKARTGLFASSSSNNTKLFEGMAFLLTHLEKTAEQRAEEKQLLQDSSLDTSADDNTDIEPEIPPFVKDHIQSTIERGGGTVLHSFDEIAKYSSENCYLVAAEHQRTVKYLKALAAGLTIISHQWVLDSAAENELQGLKAYILPAGICLEKKKLIEGTKGCPEIARLTFMIVSTNQEFTEAWASILTIARGHIVTRFPARASKNDPGVDIVVSDKTCPANIVRRCGQLDVPLVSSEWIAQCLICGYLVDMQGHDKYRHNFSE